MPDGQHFAFLALARDLGLLKPEDAASLLHSQIPAPDAAVARRFLSPETAQGVLGALGRGRFECAGCGLRLQYGHLETLPSLACPTCRQTLAFREPSGRQRPASDRSAQVQTQARRPHGAPHASAPSGVGRPASERRSGLGHVPSDRHQSRQAPSSDRVGRPSSRRAKHEEPQRIGEFYLERQLGRGNNGVVYLGRRSGLDRPFAIKILLHTAALGEEARQRFRLEAQIGSKLVHPGIVPVYDIGEENDYLYFAMEYVEGEDLAQRLKREGALPHREAATLIHQLADALAEAHQQQVIHRDLKPGNVLLPHDGSRPRLTDFGLARDRELADSMTKSGDILGTPFYMAPEQLQGSRVTPQADVYALGVILYQCLTGHRPYEAKTPFDLAKKIMAGQCTPPSQLEEEIPPALEGICLRAMAVDPRERILNAEALVQALGDHLAGRRVKGAPSKSGGLARVLIGGLLAAALGVALTLGVAANYKRSEAFEQAFASLQEASPESPAELEAGLQALKDLDEGDPRYAEAQAWAAAWQAIWRADRAVAQGSLGEAKGALAEVEANQGSGPFLSEALAERRRGVEQSEALLALEAEVRGQPLSGELVGRWRELRAQATAPALRARIHRSLLDRLLERHWLEEFTEESESLEGEERARADFDRAWIKLERGQQTEARAEFKVLSARVGEIPESTRLMATAALHYVNNQAQDALPLLQDALAQEPDLPRAQLLLAIVLGTLHQSPKAEGLFDKIQVTMVDDASRAIWRARSLLSLKKAREGLAEAKQALTLQGDRTTERALVAALLGAYMLHDAGAQERYLKLGKRRFPHSSSIALLRGAFLQEAKGEQAAIAVWVEAWRRDAKGFSSSAQGLLGKSAGPVIEIVRDAAEGRSQLSKFFLALGEVPQAASKNFDLRTLSIDPPQARDLVHAALVKLARGQPYADVAKDFNTAIELAPTSSTLAALHAEVLLGRDRLAEVGPALARCAALNVSERHLTLLRADLATRQGDFAGANQHFQALCAPSAPHDEAWFCARATLISNREGDKFIEQALRVLQACDTPRRFWLYTFIRLSFSSRDRSLVRRAIQKQFSEEGLVDTATLTFYCLEQTRRLARRPVPGLLELTAAASERLFRISEGAWTRLALAQMLLLGMPKQKWLLDWVDQRLRGAENFEPRRPRIMLLRGVRVLLGGGSVEDMFSYWDKAKERGATQREFADWAIRLSPRFPAADFTPYAGNYRPRGR